MTPAINLAKKANIAFSVHSYQHDAGSVSYGLEAVDKLGLAPEQVFKTLVVALDNKQLAVAVVPVAATLNLKRIAAVLGAKKAEMADKNLVSKSTGYVLGGVSPLGQKKALATVIDNSASTFTQIYVSAGRRGLEIALAPTDLALLTKAEFADIAQWD